MPSVTWGCNVRRLEELTLAPHWRLTRHEGSDDCKGCEESGELEYLLCFLP